MKPLSKVQARALSNLSACEGQCAFVLGESMRTLYSLCRRGLAVTERLDGPHYPFYSPRVDILFRLKAAE